MSRARAFILLSLCCAVARLVAQPPNSDCANALTLCAAQSQVGNNTGAQAPSPFCADALGSVWYTFTTNGQGGPVVVEVTDIDCAPVVGMDDELSVVVLSGNGSCLPGSFGNVSACGTGGSTITLTTQALLPATQYWLVVAGMQDGGATIPAQCPFNISISGPGADIVGVDFSAGPDVEIGEGESIQLGATGGPPYDWSPLAGLSANGVPDPFASPASTTTYTVTTVLGGCTYSDTVLVRVFRRIDPPNTITPNGDGYNDVWLIPGINDHPGAEVQIHDRWGQVVYRSTGYRIPWDGTRNGRDLPVGTYYYHITLPQVEGRSEPYTGYISIVR